MNLIDNYATAGPALDTLIQLFQGRSLAERVPEFIPPDTARALAERLVPRVDYGFLKGVPNLGCLGLAYKTAAYDASLRELYYARAAEWEARQRAACVPLRSPLDAMLDALARAWPAGVERERVDGPPMFAGAVRVLVRGHGSPPHQDLLARDAGPVNPRVRTLRGHYATTLYLLASQSGGELDVWDQRPYTKETVTRDTKEIDAYDRDLLGQPAVTLAASAGDLIIYDNQNIHSTRPDRDGLQVTVSVIIGYRGDTEPLSVWS